MSSKAKQVLLWLVIISGALSFVWFLQSRQAKPSQDARRPNSVAAQRLSPQANHPLRHSACTGAISPIGVVINGYTV